MKQNAVGLKGQTCEAGNVSMRIYWSEKDGSKLQKKVCVSK